MLQAFCVSSDGAASSLPSPTWMVLTSTLGGLRLGLGFRVFWVWCQVVSIYSHMFAYVRIFRLAADLSARPYRGRTPKWRLAPRLGPERACKVAAHGATDSGEK